MNDRVSMRLVYATCPDMDVAQNIADDLIEKQHAACVNIIPGMVSTYRWEGKISRDQEVVLIIKTVARLVEQVVNDVRDKHPYDVPAILVLPIETGNPQFLSWVDAEVRTSGGDKT